MQWLIQQAEKIGSTDAGRFLKASGIYIGGFLFILFMSHFLGFTNLFPQTDNLIRWDAGFYATIAQGGYQYYWFAGSNSAFFPLFPYVWRWLHLNDWQMSLFNFIIFLVGVYLLFKNFRFSITQTVCYLSVPSAIFFFLPFTEAFFFLFSAILLVGLQRKNTRLILTGLFFCSMTRATAMFFIPAIVCMELFASRSSSLKSSALNAGLYVLASLLGLFVVVGVQYYQTYEWFAFAKVQTKFYHHIFAWPGFPLVSFGDNKLLWLDGLALFFGILAASLCIIFAIKFFLRSNSVVFQHRPFWFSAVYLAMVAFYSVFYNDSDPEELTPINSINRYIFASAYFFVFAKGGLDLFKIGGREYLLYFLVGMLTWFALGFGQPVRYIASHYESEHRVTVFFGMMALYTFAFLYLKKAPQRFYVGGVLFCLNLILTIYILTLYLKGEWVA